MTTTVDGIGKTFHAAVFLYYGAVNYKMFSGLSRAHELLGRPKDDPLVNRMLDGSLTYFTVWNLTVQVLYFSICCLEHIVESIPKAFSPNFREQLQKFQRMALTVFLIPCASFVVCMFWLMYAISPSLVYGDFLDVINPPWINHAIHTTIAPLAIFELILRAYSGRLWTGSFSRGALSLIPLQAGYLFVICAAYIQRGFWPYPFLDPMSVEVFVGFIILTNLILLFWLYVGMFVGKKIQEMSPRSTHRALKTEKVS